MKSLQLQQKFRGDNTSSKFVRNLIWIIAFFWGFSGDYVQQIVDYFTWIYGAWMWCDAICVTCLDVTQSAFEIIGKIFFPISKKEATTKRLCDVIIRDFGFGSLIISVRFGSLCVITAASFPFQIVARRVTESCFSRWFLSPTALKSTRIKWQVFMNRNIFWEIKFEARQLFSSFKLNWGNRFGDRRFSRAQVDFQKLNLKRGNNLNRDKRFGFC